MSTRSQIGFYPKTKTKLSRPDFLLYRHCDGCPEGMIPDLTPFLKSFNKYRGLDDTEYASARCMQYLCNLGDKEMEKYTKDNPDYLSYGITKRLHNDIEYYYAVYPDRLEVYEIANGFWDAKQKDKYELMELIQTEKLKF